MLSFVTASLLALTLQTGEQSGSVSGRVIDALSAAPIPGAVVVVTSLTGGGAISDRSVMPRRRETSTHTETDGRYVLDALAPGSYVVKVEHPDYVTYDHLNLTPDGNLERAVVSAGRDLQINVRMVRAATIRGHVTDETGRPLARVSVATEIAAADRVAPSAATAETANASLWNATIFEMMTRSVRAETNDAGQYELRVPIGSYLLRATVPPSITDGLQMMYYPGVTKQPDASAVRVSAGDRLNDINIIISRASLSVITGRVISSAETSVPVAIFLVSSPAGKLVRTTTQPGGSFKFDGLKPGRYIVWSKLSTRDLVEVASEALNVAQDTIELELSLRPAGRVSGQVVAEGAAAPPDGIRVIAALMDGSHDVDPTAPDQVEMDADGRFAIDGLFGTRRLRVIGLPPEWSLKSVLLNGREISPPHVEVGYGRTIEGIRIVLTRR